MSRTFRLNFKRGVIAVSGVAMLTLLASWLAKSALIGEPLSPMAGHEHHAAPGAFFDNLLKVYTPRRACMFYEPVVIWLHFISDFLIALSYFSIPVALIYFIRRRKDLAFTWVFWMFAAFILLCGTTHIVGMWALWQPLYKVDGIIKFLTGLVSIVTAINLWPLIPKALALPSPAMLEQRVNERTRELAAATAEKEKLLETEQQLRIEAERASKLKDEFLATLSHELRTPLNAILGWTQVLKKRTVDDKQLEPLDIIERNTRSQVRLVEDLLDTSRIVTGKLRLDVHDVDVTAVLDAATESVLPAARAKEIDVQKVLDPNCGKVRGDASRLQQVFWNLLNNAVKFTPKGGRVQIFCEQANGHVEVSVADTGIGVEPEFLPHLFERFSQFDSSTTRRFGGVGLGLAIARHLVELHGGNIRAESVGQDKGATFVVRIPVQTSAVFIEPVDGEENLASFARPEGEGTVSLDGLKVLAVDDEPDALSLLRTVLSQAGAKVFIASSAEEAFEHFKRERPDILLCDIGMPVEDGYSLLRRVRRLSREEGGDAAAIALTAFARSEDRIKSLRAGFQMHMAKPFEAQELLAVVASIVSRHRDG